MSLRIRRFTDRYLQPETARVAATAVLVLIAAGLVVMLAVPRPDGATWFGPNLGGDFAQFYAIGVLQDRHGVTRLYDLSLQDEILHEVVPGVPSQESYPFVYPPFVAWVVRPLARLPYRGAFLVWLTLSAAAYSAAIALMLRMSPTIAQVDRLSVWLLAWSFEPFVVECWINGQLASFGTLSVAVALACLAGGRPFMAGLALAGLGYKPTLLVLIVPMLVVGRRGLILAGLTLGGAVLIGFSLVVAGVAVFSDFLSMMAIYGRLGGGAGSLFRTIKYVDLTAFFKLLGLPIEVARPLAITLALPALAWLATAWWRADRHFGPSSRLAWAATLGWLTVLNVYGPVYDATLAVPGVILAADVIWRRARTETPDRDRFRGRLGFLYGTALVSPVMAVAIGFQPATLGLIGMALFLTGASQRVHDHVT